MSLFTTAPSASSLAPLFNLLDDYDNHLASRNRGYHTSVRSFSPRFDVRETSDAYHLDGELPGVAQKDIDIEFTDPQTIVIKGRVERQYHSANTDTTEKQPRVEDEGSSNEVTKTGEKQVTKSASSEKPRYWVSERSVGEFQRTFSFPSRVGQDRVRASLRDGILSVVVPKEAPPSTKKITIQ
ncbi:Hsp20/alpha crystallin family protein [Aspergillus foveolatus]|uniref:Hsp20/alpha crystallin family protein n=1 Tax=Aspergillus foveolatus TaxID=210207 RepID=UPI003CCE375C